MSLFSFFTQEIAIDLGTANTLIIWNDKVVVDEPSIVAKDIQSGKFTKQWMDEHKSGQKNFLKMRKDLADHPIEKVGKELRAMMPWIGKNKLVDKDKN